MTEHKTIFRTFPKKIIIDYFKGLLMTHHLDIFMSGKNLGLNGFKSCSCLLFIGPELTSTAMNNCIFNN